MSKPRDRWWGYARGMIRDYPELKKMMVEGECLSEADRRDYHAVRKAIEDTELIADGQRHIDLITLAYWSRRNILLKDAALKLSISEQTAKLWHRDFVRLVGKHRGLKV